MGGHWGSQHPPALPSRSIALSKVQGGMLAARSPAACSISPGQVMMHRGRDPILLPQPFWGHGRRKRGQFLAPTVLMPVADAMGYRPSAFLVKHHLDLGRGGDDEDAHSHHGPCSSPFNATPQPWLLAKLQRVKLCSGAT